MNETIINGVDVSECNIRFNHFGKNICELGNRKLGELHYLCSENPNCYFKQFKRLEEECKILQEAQEQAVEQEEELERLQKENKELKETTEKGNKTNADLIESIVRHKEKISKYKQALEEIKDRLIMPESLPENYTLKKYILEKCNEVLK